MAGKRQARNRNLPPNLYRNGAGFIYIHPVTKKRFSWNATPIEAIATAKELNARLTSERNARMDLVEKVLNHSKVKEQIGEPSIEDMARIIIKKLDSY